MIRMLTATRRSQRLTCRPGNNQRSQPLEERILKAIPPSVETDGSNDRLQAR
jgi:hypothetical protein